MRRFLPRSFRVADVLAVLVTGSVATGRFLALHAHLAPTAAPSLAHPQPTPVMGWWNWWDQGCYQRAAVAWANGITDPAHHWYLPGYPLLGAPFTRLLPADPFLVPNLACLLASLACTVGLGRRLLAAGAWSVPLSCVVFAGATIVPAVLLRDWVVPWSTTPEAACFLAALLAVAGFPDAPAGGRRALAAGLAAGAVGVLRPVDGVVIIAAVGAGVLALRRRQGLARTAVAAAGGTAASLAVGIAAYLAVWGPHASPYVISSRNIGFEFGLLKLRWVSIMLDPAPLLPGGRGLVEAFPWVAVGIAGLLASLAGRGRTVHVVVGGATIADLLLFLCYRDLHASGLWRFELHHYFKAPLLLLGLYAARFVVLAVRAPVTATVGAAVAALLLCRHLALEPERTLPWTPDGIDLPTGLQPLDVVALVPGGARSDTLVVEGAGTIAGGRVLHFGLDVVAYDPGGTLRVVPVRRLPAADTRLRFDAAARLDRSRAPLLAREVIDWGWPPSWWRKIGPPPGA